MKMQQHQQIEDTEFAPSFSYYSSNTKTSRAVAKVIREQGAARIHENGHFEGEDFEFSLVLSDEESESRGWNVFTRDLLVDHRRIMGRLEDSSSSYSSSEADELESPTTSTSRNKCKKSSSTGSGSKRWIFRYLLRRSNSECKGDSTPKHKTNSSEVTKVGGRLKAQTPVHEQFYVQRRAENEFGKRKTYLPYRKDLVGLFAGKYFRSS